MIFLAMVCLVVPETTCRLVKGQNRVHLFMLTKYRLAEEVTKCRLVEEAIIMVSWDRVRDSEKD